MRLQVVIAAGVVAPLAVSLPPVLEPRAARELSLVGIPEVFLRLQPNQPFSTIVDLRVFGSLTAGISIAEAEKSMGPPQQLYRGQDYPEWRYARYETTRAFVDVAYEPSSSMCATYHRQTLYAYPKTGSWALGDVLSAGLTKGLNLPPNATRVLIISSDDRDRAWCLVRDGKVEVVNWHHAGS